MPLIVSLVIVTLIITAVIINNQIIGLKNQSSQAFGSIEVYLKKRFDLIPSLIAMINKYLAHEKDLLVKITELRAQTEAIQTPEEKIETSNKLTKVMGGLNVNVENYPDLKADKQFANLEHQLIDIEDQISAARRAYNASVTLYNNKIQMFPASVVAGVRKDKTLLLLEIPKADQKEVDVKELLKG